MRTRPIPPLLLALALACDSQYATQPSAPADRSARASELPEFDPADFVAGVDNRLFPLPLGRRLIYRGTEDGEPEQVVTDVTRDRKTILGVRVVVVLDRVYLSGELIEKTFDWYAQDRHGNVWYFGEDTREFENGKVVSTAGSFEAGKDGARAGIIMRAHPKLGQVTPQESAPGVAEDESRVLDRNVMVAVPYGTFRHCLETEDFTPLEPGALEQKFYCRGVGVVSERDVRGGTVHTALTRIVSRRRGEPSVADEPLESR
jgi:hypothetical protein